MKRFLLMLAALCFLRAHAQTITVIDKTTREHIPGVVIRAGNGPPIFTNAKGRADLTAFAREDSISFSYTNYETMHSTFSELEKNKFKIELGESNIHLSEVVVSANRWEGKKRETPNRVERLDMKEVAFQNPQTTADLLGTSGYAFIQKSQLGGGSPMLRGMATNRVLLVVDGVRMNNAIFRAGNLQNVISLDANALESTEILFGPGAVMYGSDAIGGVMDFHTLKPKFADTLSRWLTSGNALIRTSTANSEKTGHLDFNIGVRKWAFVTSLTRADYSDLRSGSVGGVNAFYRPYYVQTADNKDRMVRNNDSTLQVGSKYSQDNFMQKVRFKPNRYWDLEYGFHISQTSNYNRYDRLYVMQTSGTNKGTLRWAEWYYGPQKWNMQRIGITSTKATRAYDRLRLVGALQNFEESRYDRQFMAQDLRMQKETVKALSLNLDLDKKLGERMTLHYGAELLHNTVGSFAHLTHIITKEMKPTATRYPDGATWQSYGAYMSLKYRLTEKLIVSGGARYSYYRIKASFDTTVFPYPFTQAEMSNCALSGSLGFVFAASKSWQLFINGATGFRAPNIDDMGKVFESTPGFLVIPNPRLKPEHAYNAEIGTVKSFGNMFRFDVAAYYTLLEGAMERRDAELNGSNTITYQGTTSRVQSVQNVTKAFVYGVQAGFEFSYRGVGLRSTCSYQYGKEQSPDSLTWYPLRHAAPMFGSTHLSYHRQKLKFDFYVIYNGKMDPDELALTERVNPSYARDYSMSSAGLAYVAAWYTLNFKAAFYINHHVALMAGIENITDRLYRPYGSGINAPGRNLIVTLRAKF